MLTGVCIEHKELLISDVGCWICRAQSAEDRLLVITDWLLIAEAAGHEQRANSGGRCYSTCLACFAVKALRAAEGKL